MESDSTSAILERPFLWARGIAARETLRYLDKNGIDAEPLLSKTAVPRSVVSRTRRYIRRFPMSVSQSRRDRDG